MTEPHTTVSESQNLEIPLKTLLENILGYLEKFISSQTEISLIENKLHDYESIQELMDITLDIWCFFSQKLNEKLESFDNKAPSENLNMQEEYRKLEESLQKHEAQIRNHIAVEQQLRLCAETFQNKSEELQNRIENERAIHQKEIKNLKDELLENQTTLNTMKKTIQLYEKTLENNEKTIEEMRKKLTLCPNSDEKRALSHKSHKDEESPNSKCKSTQRIPDNFVQIKDYLRVRNEKKVKSTSVHQKFEEIPIPPKAFSALSHIYGNSLNNIFKNKPKKKKLNQSNQIPFQNHIINMNFHKNLPGFNNSGQNFLPKNTTNLNINVTNLTNSLIVNHNPQNNLGGTTIPYIQKSSKPRRSKSQGNYNKIGIQGLGLQKI